VAEDEVLAPMADLRADTAAFCAAVATAAR
jgi:hypothetical protein